MSDQNRPPSENFDQSSGHASPKRPIEATVEPYDSETRIQPLPDDELEYYISRKNNPRGWRRILAILRAVKKSEKSSGKKDKPKTPVWNDDDYLYRETRHWSNLVVALAPWVFALFITTPLAIWIFIRVFNDLSASGRLLYAVTTLFVIGLIFLGTWRIRYKHDHEFLCVIRGDLVKQDADNKWLFLFGNSKKYATRNFSETALTHSVFQKYFTQASDLSVKDTPDRVEVINNKQVIIPAKPKVFKRVKDGERLMKAIADSKLR